MSYKIENKEMGFLNKLVETLEELEKEYVLLEVHAYDVPRSDDRHPYSEDDIADDFPFMFTYKGKDFSVETSTNSDFILTVSKDDTEYKHEITFTMKERKPSLKKMWKQLLVKLDDDLKLQVSSHHFFDLWFDKQRIGETLYDKEKKNAIKSRLHAQLIPYIKSEVIEEELEKRYKEARNVSDLLINEHRVSQVTHVEFHQFLGGELYIVYSDGEFFVLKELEEALKKYEEENVRRIKEKVGQEIKHFMRVRT